MQFLRIVPVLSMSKTCGHICIRFCININFLYQHSYVLLNYLKGCHRFYSRELISSYRNTLKTVAKSSIIDFRASEGRNSNLPANSLSDIVPDMRSFVSTQTESKQVSQWGRRKSLRYFRITRMYGDDGESSK